MISKANYYVVLWKHAEVQVQVFLTVEVAIAHKSYINVIVLTTNSLIQSLIVTWYFLCIAIYIGQLKDFLYNKVNKANHEFVWLA